MDKKPLIEQTAFNGIIGEPVDVAGIALPPLCFGTYLLLRQFNLLILYTADQLTFALFLCTRGSYKAARESIAFRNDKGRFKWRDKWRYYKRRLWQWKVWLSVRNKAAQAQNEWTNYIIVSKAIPDTQGTKASDSQGFPQWLVIRNTLLDAGYYTPESIVEAPLSQVCHDYLWVSKARVDNKRNREIEAILRKAKEDARS